MRECFATTVGLDDVGEQPTDEAVMSQLINQYETLHELWKYAARTGTKQNAIMEELWEPGEQSTLLEEIN